MNVEIVIGTENIFNAKEIYSMKENCKNEVLDKSVVYIKDLRLNTVC